MEFMELKYCRRAMNNASINGHIDVLEWWKNSGYELKYDYDNFSTIHASSAEWWKNSGLKYNGYIPMISDNFDY